MARKAKPVRPAPTFRDAWDAYLTPLHLSRARKEALRHFPWRARAISEHRKLKFRIADIASDLGNSRYERKRLDNLAVRSRLETLAHHLNDAMAAMDELGFDAVRELELAARHDAILATRPVGIDSLLDWRDIEPSNFPNPGNSRLRVARAAMESVAAWAEYAATQFPEPRRGRPDVADARAAVRALAALWGEYCGKPPTIVTNPETGKASGQFLDFIRAVISPVFACQGFTPPRDFASIAKDVLYRRPSGAAD